MLIAYLDKLRTKKAVHFLFTDFHDTIVTDRSSLNSFLKKWNREKMDVILQWECRWFYGTRPSQLDGSDFHSLWPRLLHSCVGAPSSKAPTRDTNKNNN